MKEIKQLFKNFYEDEEVLNVEVLGGMTNTNYLVTTSNASYILKLFGKGTDKLIDRKIEKENLKITQNIGLDVKNYVFDIEKGIKINEYIERATTLNKKSIKNNFEEVANILKTIHCSEYELHSVFDVFFEIEKYTGLIKNEIDYPYYRKILPHILNLKNNLDKIGINLTVCHIDLVPENFIKTDDKIYLIDWEYSAMNDAMWDLAALFLESDFTQSNENDFFNFYKTESTPINKEKILIYKILQDFLWSLWSVYKEEQGANFDGYGKMRYMRALQHLKEYKKLYEK